MVFTNFINCQLHGYVNVLVIKPFKCCVEVEPSFFALHFAVDHTGSYHYFHVICLKQGEQVSIFILRVGRDLRESQMWDHNYAFLPFFLIPLTQCTDQSSIRIKIVRFGSYIHWHFRILGILHAMIINDYRS